MATGPARSPLDVPRDHPAFAGHFPGHPILPGAVILAEVMAAIEAATARGPESWEITSAKFLAPVQPGTALVLQHEPTRSGGVSFEVRDERGVIASGVLAPRDP